MVNLYIFITTLNYCLRGSLVGSQRTTACRRNTDGVVYRVVGEASLVAQSRC